MVRLLLRFMTCFTFSFQKPTLSELDLKSNWQCSFLETLNTLFQTCTKPHMWRRWGAPQNFCLAEKHLFIEKHRDISSFYTCVPKSKRYDLKLFRYRLGQTEIDNYGSFFVLLPINQKKTNFEKMKQIAVDIIILHKRIKSHNHMRYSSWDTKCYRQNFLSIGPFFFFLFFFLYVYTEKMKKSSRDVIILHMCAKTHNHMMYVS